MSEVLSSVVITVLKIPNMSVLIIWVAINMAKKIIIIKKKLCHKRGYCSSHSGLLSSGLHFFYYFFIFFMR